MKKYYIQLFSPHGLIRYEDPEIGRDKDTGGQVKYVLELLKTVSLHPSVRKVDLFTRRIIDKKVSTAYSKEVEAVNEKARIIRIDCGGHIYRQKEMLWDFLDEFVDNTIRFIENEDDIPDVVHGHYADGNYIAGELAKVFGIPFIATAHSLGRNKTNMLQQQGLSAEVINEKFNMDRRISEEENYLKTADTIITSTQFVLDTQYSLYSNKECGKFEVIHPGVNLDHFYPFFRQEMPAFKISVQQEQSYYRIHSEIDRFLFQPAKPLILSIGRPDRRKNFESIIQAFGQDKELQAMANLAIFAGVRKDISRMPPDEQEILTNLLLLLDKYDLYGKMAIPKKNDPQLEVPEIYRIAARKKGVFINATPGENFGLTILEAAACGLPVIASPTGGPREILETCNNGMLINVEDPQEIAAALKKIISDQPLWNTFSSNGIQATQEKYSWEKHVEKYIQVIHTLSEKQSKVSTKGPNKTAYGKKLSNAELFIISDLDGTLIGKDENAGLDEVQEWITRHQEKTIFGIASGRNKELTVEGLTKNRIRNVDVLICSAGSEIFYTDKLIPDKQFASYIDYQWKRNELKETLEKFEGIRLQEPAAQWPYKLSYYTNGDFSENDLADLYQFLDLNRLRSKILLTENKFLDFLPLRAGKGNAVRYLSHKWKKPLEKFITAGNGGNDLDMLRGKSNAIVVANHDPELDQLRRNKDIYFSRSPFAYGVLEGIEHFLKKKTLILSNSSLR